MGILDTKTSLRVESPPPHIKRSENQLEDLFTEYSNYQQPIQVDFRTLVDWIPYGERSSHMIHLYPAKLLPHIPAFFLSNDILSKKNDTVLDPFSGSGTVMLEAILAGRKAIGADSNPLARLISKVKTTKYDIEGLRKTFSRIKKKIEKKNEIKTKSDVINIDFWFYEKTIEELSRIKQEINTIKNKEHRDFFKISFSNTIKRSSLADPKLSVPVKLNERKYDKNTSEYIKIKKIKDKIKEQNTYSIFYKLTESNLKRIETLNDLAPSYKNDSFILNDARKLQKIESNSIQLIITSPPYAGAQKYIRSSGLNLGWLDFCASNNLRFYEKKNIGREHYYKKEYENFKSSGLKCADKILQKIYESNPLRAYITSNYLLEMKEALKENYRVLKPNGYLVLVSSANKICDINFETHKHLCEIAIELGLKVELKLIDEIHSRGLMTKRNKTAGIINCEWVYVFKKA